MALERRGDARGSFRAIERALGLAEPDAGNLPRTLSAPEIAAELFVSTSTVKTHMRQIYAKLEVHKRTEAVERARELGLLGRSTLSHR